MRSRSATAVLSALVSLTSSCGEGRDSAASATVSASGSAAPPSAPALSSSEVADELSTKPLELLKFSFTSDVKDKSGVDVLTRAVAGKRVYGHLTLRNRSGRPRQVSLTFSVDGEKRTELDLKIGESWSWRTWGYNTLQKSDSGKKLRLEVVDDEGHSLVDESIPIGP